MRTEELKSLWQLAFGDSMDFIDLFFRTAYAPEKCAFLEENGTITAALYWLDTECYGNRYAYIYGVATHPDFRGRGLCRTLMAQTHALLRSQGCAGAVLMPAKPGLRQMYAKMGYVECSTLSQFDCTAGQAVEVRPIGQEEYARLRRTLLPEGGLIQEGENMRYLETYAALYAGTDFLLAAVHEDGQLFGLELLGDPNAAPGILGAMGYEKGTFRIPGKEIPFAMFHPLTENAKMPQYLGLAFD